MPDRRSTRRQVLGLGAAAFAAVSLKPPASALAGRRALFELDLAGEDLTASIAGARWRTTRVLRAPRRFDLIGLRWARGSQRRGAGARAPARRPLDRVGGAARHGRPRARRRAPGRRHRPGVRRRRRRVPAAPARQPARAARPLRARPADRDRRPPGRRAPAPARAHLRPPPGPGPVGARDHPDRVGRRLRPAARARRLRHGRGRVRAPHGDDQHLRPRGLGGDRARDRPLPPRLQRLERPRLQLPRRQVRPGLRGPRRRHRRARHRRPGAGLQQRLDRDRGARHPHADRGLGAARWTRSPA